MSAIDLSDPATIAFLADALAQAGVDSIEVSRPGGQLRIVVADGQKPRVNPAESVQSGATSTVIVKASMAGHFCAAQAAAADDLPRSASATDILGFLRVGPVLLPVQAGRDAMLTRRLAAFDALVGFGTPLFEIEPQS